MTINQIGDTECQYTRRRVMNEDVLKQILSYLPLRDKVRLERVNRQFLYCARELLRDQTTLTIGDTIDDRYECEERGSGHSTGDSHTINHFCRRDECRLGPLFAKCPNIKCVELLNCKIEARTFRWLTDVCPRLECVRIGGANYLTESDWQYVGELLGGRLVHLYIYSHRISEPGLNALIRGLSALRELTIKHFHSDFRQLFSESLSPNLRTLQLMDCTNFELNELFALQSGNGRNVRKLCISSGPLFSNFNEKFSFICNNFQHLQSLSFLCNSSELCLRHLDKLVHLRHLKIQYFENNFLDFSSLNAIRPMDSLRSLHIECAYFSPRMLDTIEKKFRSVKRLSLVACNFCCGCAVNDFLFDNCIACYAHCWQSVSKLPELRRLHIRFYSFHITEPLLKLLPNFKRLTCIEFPTYRHITHQLVELLVDSCVVLATRNHRQWITLKSHPELRPIIEMILCANSRPKNLLLMSIV